MTRLIAALTGMALIAATAAAQAADLVVVASSVSGIKAGQVVKDAAVIEVPAGASVMLVSQSGKMIALKGPHSGPVVVGGGGDGGGDGKLVGTLSKLLSKDKETSSVGAMRAIPGDAGPEDPWAVDVTRSGTYCVDGGGAVVLWRDKSDEASELSLKNIKDKNKSKVQWSVGAGTVEWPSEVAINDGDSYVTRQKGVMTSARLVLHLVPAGLASDAHKAAWMAEKGCVRQARLLLSNLAK